MWPRRAFLALAGGGGFCLASGQARASETPLLTPRVVAFIRGGVAPRMLWGHGIKSVDWIMVGAYRVHFATPFADTNYSLSVTTQENFSGNEMSVCEGNEPPAFVRTAASTTLIFNQMGAAQMARDFSRHSDPVGFSLQVWGA
jgi:hypothetical protein